jgi:predicted metal-dependent peptidase
VLASEAAGDDPGNIPGELGRYVKNLVKPEMPWHRILRNLTSGLAKDDYSMRRPNRRVMAKYIIPSLYSEKLMHIATATDVSGSILQKQFDHFVSEAGHIFKSLNPQELTFLQFDHVLYSPDTLHNLQDLGKVKFHGGGGTNIEPVMEWAKKNKPACLIVFTDGEYPAPRINPGVPVFWIVYGKKTFKAPFGKYIPFKF